MRDPANRQKLATVERLAVLAEQSGLPLLQLALAFVLSHPAVTSAIVGPRTAEQLDSYLAAAGVGLSTEVLDEIDRIAEPGVTLNRADTGYGLHELSPAARRFDERTGDRD